MNATSCGFWDLQDRAKTSIILTSSGSVALGLNMDRQTPEEAVISGQAKGPAACFAPAAAA